MYGIISRDCVSSDEDQNGAIGRMQEEEKKSLDGYPGAWQDYLPTHS